MAKDPQGRARLELEDALSAMTSLANSNVNAPATAGALIPILGGLGTAALDSRAAMEQLLEGQKKLSEEFIPTTELILEQAVRISALEMALACVLKVLESRSEGVETAVLEGLRTVKWLKDDGSADEKVKSAQLRLAELIDGFPG